MKKVSLVAVVVLILVGMLSTSLVSAQEDAPACSPEEITAAMESIGEGFDGLDEMTALPEEPTPADFSALVLVMDGFAYGYWQGLAEAMEAGEICAEVAYLGINSGYVFDELLIVSILNSIALHEDAAGNAEAAATFIEQAEARQATLEAGMEGMTATFDALEAGEEVELSVEYPACTEEELDASMSGAAEILSVYEELGTAVVDATGVDLSAIVAGYAELSAGYWEEFVPVLPECQEVQDGAFELGILLDDSVIVAGLMRLAELEAETGDAEVAQALADSAAARAEALEADAEAMFAEEE